MIFQKSEALITKDGPVKIRAVSIEDLDVKLLLVYCNAMTVPKLVEANL